MKILSIGNSFSEDAHVYLHTLAKERKMDLETVKKALGGRVSELANQIYQRKIMDFIREANTVA